MIRITRLLGRICLHFAGIFVIYAGFIGSWLWPAQGIHEDYQIAMFGMHMLALLVAAVSAGLGRYFFEGGSKETSARVQKFGYLSAIIIFLIGCFSWFWVPGSYWMGL